MSDDPDNLTTIISEGLNETSPDIQASVKALFGTRYHQNAWKAEGVRDRYAKAVRRHAGCFGISI